MLSLGVLAWFDKTANSFKSNKHYKPMKQKIYKKPSAKVIIADVESLLQTISGTGESGKIDWSAPKIKDLPIDDCNEDLE